MAQYVYKGKTITTTFDAAFRAFPWSAAIHSETVTGAHGTFTMSTYRSRGKTERDAVAGVEAFLRKSLTN